MNTHGFSFFIFNYRDYYYDRYDIICFFIFLINSLELTHSLIHTKQISFAYSYTKFQLYKLLLFYFPPHHIYNDLNVTAAIIPKKKQPTLIPKIEQLVAYVCLQLYGKQVNNKIHSVSAVVMI